VLEGEGIVTGGHPKLAQVRDPEPHAPVIVPIRQYAWADDTDKVTVIITFPQAQEGLVQDQIQCNFEPKNVELTVRLRELEEHKLVLKKLSHEIVPDQSRVRVKNNRVTLVLKKEVSSKWFNLVESAKVEDEKDWS
jgi:hypothetical protein